MITKDNFKQVLETLGFKKSTNLYTKKFPDLGCSLKVDFKEERLIYPLEKGFTISGEFTSSFTQKENFVVFECVHRLFQQGYKPEHIELEPKWSVGHGASGGRADIMVKDNSGKSLMIIECKTAGLEFNKEWDKTKINGGQILSYAKQAGSTQFVALYASDFVDGKVKADYYLITLKDNEKLLEDLADKEPLSFAAAKLLDKEDIYAAWTETYDQHYETRGVFEETEPYLIGKPKYTIKDLDTISSKDIQGKYHQFATILRQHNVSGRENAFDKLVNLFLCKIVDETNNPNELKFYWKGIAYDSYFDLQDRLQKLYQEGMKRFLGEEVTYIDNDAIENAFRFFKNDPDATRDTIKKYFRELKFFTNNDFAFVDVHNEKLFYQNASILLKMVRLLQDIRLKTEQENQFLGDMFEGFLDQGVKQSEGQFFTPMPIVKFILKSLPLKKIITESEEIPKVIDYACGAGHFLNEYATEIKPIVAENKGSEIEKYYGAITGIEKEYRLSKVAKVSSFMYGQDDINIIYGDALSKIPKVLDKSYSILVANPPYSVKGYLETLPAVDRKYYELINTIAEKTFPSNNSIETFFIERAKQLMKPGGVAAIILPAPILTKGKAKSTSTNKNTYVATREILLKYFDIVAIAEFGSGTFGKTGSNTVTLFLRRKDEDPAPAKQFENRINAWFKNNRKKDKVFEDEHYLKQYCTHLEIDFNDYETLLKGEPNEKLLKHEIFIQYKKEFDTWSIIKNYKKSQSYKQLSADDKKTELNERFTNFLARNEKDKLYYFVLANQNPQKVLIVKSPSKSSEMKKFLGYDWSSAKGNEGIKYLGNATVEDLPQDDEDEGVESFESEDKRVLTNLLNFQQINTPLYDPQNSSNEDKINYWISRNFEGKDIDIPEELKPFISTVNLVNMLDFDRSGFSKQMTLTPKEEKVIPSKYDIHRLGDLVDIKIGGTPSRANDGYFKGQNLWVSISEMDGQKITDTKEKITDQAVQDSNVKLIPKDTTLLSFKLSIGKTAIAGADLYTNEAIAGLIPKSNQILDEYIFQLFNAKLIDLDKTGLNTFGKSLNSGHLKSDVKIPLPPKDIQKKIIIECRAIDKEALVTKTKIENITSQLFETVKSNTVTKRVSEVAVISKKRVNPLDNPSDSFNYLGLENIEADTGKILDWETSLGSSIKSTKNVFSPNDILFGKLRPYLNKVAIPNFYGICSTEILVLKTDHPLILQRILMSEQFLEETARRTNGISLPRIKIDDFLNIKIEYPKEVKNTELKIQELNMKIQELNETLSTITRRKKQVIKKYL